MLKLVKRKDRRGYSIEGRIAGRRLRASLKTKNRQAALLAVSRIERAIAEGKESDLWPQLNASLPRATFEKFAAVVGYAKDASTWTDLLNSFTTHSRQLVTRDRMRASTLKRYEHTLRAFGSFLADEHITTLKEITKTVVERFKAWRFDQIIEKKHSRGGASLNLDVAVLHRVFAHGVEREIVDRNPVKMEGKPGANPVRGAEPFTAEELSKLREQAGEDYLIFLLLRHTGLRGGDAVALTWGEVDLNGKKINRLTQKRRKRVIIPLHQELQFALEVAAEKRNPETGETILLNPATGKPLTRPRLTYKMKSLGKRAGIKQVNPHRFRDTMAVDMLMRGSSVYDVAKILGDTTQTVEDHYTPFVPELQERARRFLEGPGGLESEEMVTLRSPSERPKGSIN